MFGIEGLTPEIFSVFMIIGLTILLFVVEVVRVDVVACMVLVLLGVTQLVPYSEVFSGFSSDAVIALIGIMIIGRGLEQTGVINSITHWIIRIGQDREKKIRFLLMGIGGLLAGFMRSVGTVALFLPIITRIRHTTGIAKANLLLPLGYCSILGSTLTLVGTGPLILLNSLLKDLDALTDATGQMVDDLHLFSVFPVGITLLLTGILYFRFFGKWMLPNIPKKRTSAEDARAYFERMYGIGGDFFEAKVLSNSSLNESTLSQWESLIDPSIAVVGIKTHDALHFPPLRHDMITTGSVVALFGPEKKVQKFAEQFGLKLSAHINVFKERLNPLYAGLSEAVVPPSSPLVGRDYKELHMRKRFSAQVLAVVRGNKVFNGQELSSLNLRPGDTLGILSSWQALADFEKNPDFVVVTSDYPHEKFYTEKTGTALLFTALTLLLLMFTPIPAALSLLLGAIGMVATKVLSIDDAYEAVSWKTVFLIAGLLPLGSAMEESQASIWLIQHFMNTFTDIPVFGIQILLALLAVFFSLVMSNVGATILLVPLAVELASVVQADPRLFALIVAINTSNAFLLPTHQANALIAGPGRYPVKTFLKAGAPLTLLYIAISLLVLNFLF